MNKIRKKLLILFFGVVMIVTCIPVTAFAAEVQELPESLEPADMAFPKSSDYEGTKYYGATVSKLGDETAFRYILLGIQPTDIQLDESEVMLYLNREGEQEKTLTAQILPENVTDKTVIWESDNEKVAVVDSDGKVTAKSMGQAKITASIGGKKAVCTVTVTNFYDIVFNSNGGTINSGNITGYAYGVGAVLPSNVTRPGYRFAGWYVQSDFSGPVVTEIGDEERGNKTYYARWMPSSTTIYYALYFNTNGGNEIPSVVQESSTVMDLSKYVPVREGYTFTGWYADELLTQPITEITLDNTKTIYAGWEEIITDIRKEQKIFVTNPYQERDLANSSRNTMSRVCTLKLGFAVEDPNLSLSYETSDPEVATVKDGKITYQGIGECTITVTAAATDLCKEAELEVPVKMGSLGTPTFTPSVTSRTAKKTFVATSSTVRGVDGWEVQYSIREDFWRPRTKDFPDTGAKLYRVTCPTMQSKRTCYIHVRGYQIIDGEKIYSDWSPVKTIKTK
mgnify:FL=1